MESSDEKDMPERRRRSSVIRRRSFTGGKLQPSTKVHLKQYMSKVRAEISEWEQLFRSRQAASRAASKHLAEVKSKKPLLNFEEVKSYLSEEDLDFMSKKPNYSQTSEDIQNLYQTLALNKRRMEICDSVMKTNVLSVQTRLNTVAEAVTLYNMTAPVWVPDVNDPVEENSKVTDLICKS